MPLRYNPTTLLESTCDACNKDLRPFPNDPDLKDMANYAAVSLLFGYGSRLDRIDKWCANIAICEDCWEKVLTVLKIPIEKENSLNETQDTPRNIQSEERRAC